MTCMTRPKLTAGPGWKSDCQRAAAVVALGEDGWAHESWDHKTVVRRRRARGKKNQLGGKTKVTSPQG